MKITSEASKSNNFNASDVRSMKITLEASKSKNNIRGIWNVSNFDIKVSPHLITIER